MKQLYTEIYMFLTKLKQFFNWSFGHYCLPFQAIKNQVILSILKGIHYHYFINQFIQITYRFISLSQYLFKVLLSNNPEYLASHLQLFSNVVNNQ